MNAIDPSTIIPVRVLTTPETSWRARLITAGRGGVLALIMNVGAVAGLIALAVPDVRPTTEQQAIAVDLVSEPPGPSGPRHDGGHSGSGQPVGTPTGNDHSADKPVEAAPKPAEPKAAERKDTDKSRVEPTPAVASASPPPVDGGKDPAPRLVEAPPDPREAVQQAERNVAGNAESKQAATPVPREVPPPPSPAVTSTQTATADVVPDPQSTATTPASVPVPASSAEQKREAENTAKLAAALPFSQSFSADMNRAALSGSGGSVSQQYRGAVYGSFRKADDLVADAEAKHLRGRAVVVFSIDDAGALTSIHVAVSSGDPAVDQTAMDIIRRSAPFPPPPPGAQRTFSPAIALGLDDP